METKATNTTFIEKKEEPLIKVNISHTKDAAVDTSSNLIITETSIRHDTSMQMNNTTKPYDPSVYNQFESINREVLLSHRNNYSKEMDKSDLEKLSISKIEKVDEGIQHDETLELDENRTSRDFQTMQILRKDSEQEEQRLLRDITGETVNTNNKSVRQDSSKKPPTDSRLERGDLDLPKLELPRLHSDNTYIKAQLPKNEGTLDSVVSEREIFKLKIPEDSLLSSRNVAFFLFF